MNSHENRFDGQTFAVGILSVTACVLFVGFMLLVQRPAHGYAQLDAGGDYKMLTQQVTRTTELLVVVDAAAKRAIAYEFDFTNKRLEIVTGIPLDQMPKPPADQVPENQGGRQRRRP